ncbi:MAG: adenylate/guanylate cyclase domain-containing protein, partial [Acidobacteria bacterium]|nr:adenylate/guanylate cyclase domain-containing protein [Acidobacteriota bacterium]
MAVTRRLAAILAADVAGYSRLMGADEEGTHERLQVHFAELVHPKVEGCRGRVVKNMGDGLLAEFASVVDAVRCAVEMQRGMAAHNSAIPVQERIAFRVGVNLGDVIVEGDDIFGDGVNVAARLEGLAEPGGVCVSGTVRDHIGDRLPYAFEDRGEQRVKNIARPIRVYRVREGDIAARNSIAPTSPSLALPDKPSIAVLPFQNMSNDAEQEYFADGIAEDIITALSRYPSLFVIARNSCFIYKGRAVDVKQIGRELGVRYVLEGSLRKAGNRLRVSAQLIEAANAMHLWANRYDRDLGDIFAVQDEITEAVTIAIAPALANAELQRAMRKPTGSLDAWSAYQHGLWHVRKANPSDNSLAQKFFQQAIDLDPTFTGGYKGLSNALVHAAVDFQTHNSRAILASAEALARQAVALDSSDAEAHSRLSNTLLLRGDYRNALQEAEEAVAASPNLASAYSNLGTALIYSGQQREGLAAFETCLRLNPRAPPSASHLNHKMAALYFLCEYEIVVELARDVIRIFPDYPHPYRWLAAALGKLDRFEEATEALERAIA